MKRIIALTCGLTICLVLVAGCVSNATNELNGDEIVHFIEENKTTGNEHATVEDAMNKFKKGLIVTDDGLKTLAPYLTKETPESWLYHITLIQNKGLHIFGYLTVEKRTRQITKSYFIALKYRL